MRKSLGQLLLVTNDSATRTTLESVLRQMRFDAWNVESGVEAVTLVRAFRYEMVILDSRAPRVDAIRTCRELRRLRPGAGILAIADGSRRETIPRVLDAGADACIICPAETSEFRARIRSIIRRTQSSGARMECVTAIGGIRLDAVRHAISRDGSPVHLTPKEFDLLCYLMSNAGATIAHSRLLSAVWGPRYSEEVEYLRTYIGQLRKKLNDDAANPRYLLTVPNVGYCFNCPFPKLQKRTKRTSGASSRS